MDTTEILTTLFAAAPVFIFSLTLHEYAHAIVARRLGDDTAEMLGRLTLNPLPHIDLVGTIVMPLIGLWSGFIFGWAKPVPFNPRKLRRGSFDIMLVASAGPASNLVLLVLFAVLGRGLLGLSGVLPDLVSSVLLEVVRFGILINALLAVFNLLPLPPLDGSKILAHFLPSDMGRTLLRLDGTISFVVLMVLVFNGVLRAPLALLERFANTLMGV